MLVFHTEIHIITFLVILLELVFFFYQIVYYLSRTSDKNRLYYLVLLYLLIQHNLIGGLLPDKNIPIPIIVQNIIAYAVAFMLGMYFPYYFYKAFNLKKLKFYAYWGSVIFLFGPFILCFIIPYYITNDFAFSRKLTQIVPCIYSFSFLYSLAKAIKNRILEDNDKRSKREIIGMYIAVILFTMLPLIAFFETDLNELLKPILHFHNGSQVVEVLTINSGLVVVTILFIRQTVEQSRAEYEKLLDSERKLQEANSELMAKVKERTLELELANEQRTNTFINLAHETKTPLILINNYLGEYMSRYKEADPLQSQELTIIKNSIDKLTKDIVNFFDLERIQKGFSIYNHNRNSDFSNILKANIPLFRKFSQRKCIEITDSIDDQIFIRADPNSLDRVINNLIENAIKYTPKNGKIQVSLYLNADIICFSVKDNGLGIPKAVQGKIFDPYYQINSEKANFQGMGLGLSIVKKITESLKGSIFLTSDPETGTEIMINLPAPVDESSSPTTISDYTPNVNEFPENAAFDTIDVSADRSKPTIMVVEDNIQLLHFMQGKLKRKYNIHIASNGNDAFDKLKAISQLDLIISDVMMDNGDGYEFCKNVSALNSYRHIPFIFITAKATAEEKIKGLNLGAIDYIFKPFLIEELISKIDSLLKNMSEQRKALIDSAYRTLIYREPIVYSDTSTNDFDSKCRLFGLTAREIEIVKVIAKGHTNKEIAEILFISDKTVAKHVQNIFQKISANNKVEMLNKLDFSNATVN